MLPWLSQGVRKNIAVIGDIILDEYLDGEVQRISPEAPVPIHLVKKTLLSPGGAANAARNVQLAGAQAFLFGVWGQDSASSSLKEILNNDGVDISGVIEMTDRPTIKKTRITSGHQQMMRIDWEKNKAIEEKVQRCLLDRLAAKEYGAILISDYGKGGLPESFLKAVFSYANGVGIPVIVDPKGKDFSRYHGCDLMTPNRKEACEALEIDAEDQDLSGEDLGRALQKRFSLKQVLVTLGGEGMAFVPESQNEVVTYKSPRAREVFDVSGAGDTVVAIMSLCLATNYDVSKSLDLANLAAGIVVEKWGTQPIKQIELEQALQEGLLTNSVYSSREKIHNLASLSAVLDSLKKTQKKVVFTNGCFDLLHAGHLSYLEKARSLGDALVVGVNSDESVRLLKGSQRPLVELSHRLQLIAGLGCVDYVVSFSEETPFKLISAVKPDILVKGADYIKEDIVGADIVEGLGGEVQCIELVEGLSSTNLLENIKKNIL